MTAAAPGGRLAENVAHFGRLLRRAGLPVGPDRILDAVRAAAAVGLARRDDFYWALHAVFVARPEERAVFARAFERFFRERGGPQDALALLSPRIEREDVETPPGARRARALAADAARRAAPAGAPAGIRASFSDRETLRHRDFEQMTADEVRRATALVARLELAPSRVASRRLRPAATGRRVDARASLRAGLRTLAADVPLRWREPAPRETPIVLLVDVSGSMSRYSRMLLHFAHALASARPRVHVFVFGTRLSNVTRYLRARDVDAALARVGREVGDWAGGTRIGAALHAFNRRWSRRVLATGATVVLVTDGLDRGDADSLAREAALLARSCRRLVWLNPLLRFAGFAPRAAGVRALLPHVDDFRPTHDLASLEDVARLLSDVPTRSRSVRAAEQATQPAQ